MVWLKAKSSAELSSVIHIIKSETYQACGHDQGIPLHQAPFEQARGITEHARQDRGAVDADAVDDPLVPPTGERCGSAGDGAGGVDGAVDDVCVEPRTGFARPSTPRRTSPTLRRPVKT